MVQRPCNTDNYCTTPIKSIEAKAEGYVSECKSNQINFIGLKSNHRVHPVICGPVCEDNIFPHFTAQV